MTGVERNIDAKGIRMLTIAEAAAELGLSEGRVRALARSGELEAEKRGGRWMVCERSVRECAAARMRPGRPCAGSEVAGDGEAAADVASALYRACREEFGRGVRIDVLEGARSDEERAFYVHTTNFFMGRRCEELAVRGVY